MISKQTVNNKCLLHFLPVIHCYYVITMNSLLFFSSQLLKLPLAIIPVHYLVFNWSWVYIERITVNYNKRVQYIFCHFPWLTIQHAQVILWLLEIKSNLLINTEQYITSSGWNLSMMCLFSHEIIPRSRISATPTQLQQLTVSYYQGIFLILCHYTI